MINIAICDDDENHIRLIANQVHETIAATPHRIFTYQNCQDFLKHLKSNPFMFDIALCDILFKPAQLNGIELMKKAKEHASQLQVIFVSGMGKFYPDVYQLEHVYFLLKPLDNNRLRDALHKAIKKTIDINEDFLLLTCERKKIKVKKQSIIFLESNKRIIKVNTKDHTYNVYGKIDEYIESLGSKFCRCHKSFAVNLQYVDAMNKSAFTLLPIKKEIPISQGFSSIASTAFLQYIGAQ